MSKVRSAKKKLFEHGLASGVIRFTNAASTDWAEQLRILHDVADLINAQAYSGGNYSRHLSNVNHLIGSLFEE